MEVHPDGQEVVEQVPPKLVHRYACLHRNAVVHHVKVTTLEVDHPLPRENNIGVDDIPYSGTNSQSKTCVPVGTL